LIIFFFPFQSVPGAQGPPGEVRYREFSTGEGESVVGPIGLTGAPGQEGPPGRQGPPGRDGTPVNYLINLLLLQKFKFLSKIGSCGKKRSRWNWSCWNAWSAWLRRPTR
jgi:hypothetical protein